MSFAKNMGKSIGKNISKNLSGKYSQKLLHHAKQSPTDALKTTSKRVIQKTVEATGNSAIVANEHDKEILEETFKERYISPKEKQKIIDDLRVI